MMQVYVIWYNFALCIGCFSTSALVFDDFYLHKVSLNKEIKK